MGKKRTGSRGSGSRWERTGVFGCRPWPLTQEQRDQILAVTGTRKHGTGSQFIETLEIILGVYSSSRDFDKRTTPIKVRDRICNLQSDLVKAMERIDDLDEYSIWLLGTAGRGHARYVPGVKKVGNHLHVGATPDGQPIGEYREGFTFHEAVAAIQDLITLAGKVLDQTKEYPTTRIEDLSKKYLAYDVAVAFREQLGVAPTGSQDGSLSNVIRLLLDYAGIEVKRGADAAARDVRELVRFALKELSKPE